MVFFLIACSLQGQPEQASMEKVKNNCMGGSKPYGEIYDVTVDKSRFKIGTLDQLMELNESLVKVDMNLDSTVKKIEKQAKELNSQDLFIELSQSQHVPVQDYLRSFKWEDNKYPRARSLIEIAGMITERMRNIDGDLKKQTDELTEVKNSINAYNKGKEGANYFNKDLGEILYNSDRFNPSHVFVETHGCENLQTMIAIVHKQKLPTFFDQYEKLCEFAAVPRSAKYLDMEDKDGNQLFRFVVLATKVENYLVEARKAGLVVKKFSYNIEQYKKDREEMTKLEARQELLKSQLSNKCYYGFSELFIALLHLKVMRCYIDGVLRFGIPPAFYMAIIKPNKGSDKKLLQSLSDNFCDPAMKDMYGSKEEANDTEDFWPFVLIQLTSPIFLQ